MVRIQLSGFRPRQSLRLEHGFFCANSLCIWIVRNDALQVEFLARQYARHIGWWNLKTGGKFKIEWGGGVPCADAPGTAINIASAVRPAIESNEKVSEHFIELTFPPYFYFRFAVFCGAHV